MRLLPLLLLIPFFGPAVPAQDNPSVPARGQSERIYFSALTREEKPKLGLRESDFLLKVDGRRAAMAEFSPGRPHSDGSIPVVAWIYLDFSPDVNARMISDQAPAAAGFFDLLHPDSSVGVRIVSDRVETVSPMAPSREAVRRAFAEFHRTRTELSARPGRETVFVGPEGILGAIDLGVTDLHNHSLSEPKLRNREVRKAIVILSSGNINPRFDIRNATEKAARHAVFLYPVFVPAPAYGPWLERYFDLAKRTAGVASVLGALNPSSRILGLGRFSTGPNALTFNFIHVARDLMGKYSFAAPAAPQGRRVKIEIQSRIKDTSIRLPRSRLP